VFCKDDGQGSPWLAPGLTLLGYGFGNTAVRLMGKRPARVAELETATILTRRLLAGEDVEVNAARPARLQHALPVPVLCPIPYPHPFPEPHGPITSSGSPLR
jgi:hypothetical protein